MTIANIRHTHRLLRVWVLAGFCFFCSQHSALTQTLPAVERSSATEALQFLLDVSILPSGPVRADGATIAGILVSQSLTFPMSTSSGAFATKEVYSFSPEPLRVSRSGNFGSPFAERGITNGKRNFSA